MKTWYATEGDHSYSKDGIESSRGATLDADLARMHFCLKVQF